MSDELWEGNKRRKAADLVTADGHIQLELFDWDKTQMEGLESAIDKMRQKV